MEVPALNARGKYFIGLLIGAIAIGFVTFGWHRWSVPTEQPVDMSQAHMPNQAPSLGEEVRKAQPKVEDLTAQTGVSSAALSSSPSQVLWKSPHAGGLGVAVHAALQTRSGPDAFKLSTQLLRCEMLDASMAVTRAALQRTTVEAERQVLVHAIADEQQQLKDCQTVDGDLRQRQQQLLKIAYEAKVQGAAASYLSTYGREQTLPEEMNAVLLEDAQRGDIFALAALARDTRLGNSLSERVVFSAALAKLSHSQNDRVRGIAQSGFRQAVLRAHARGELTADPLADGGLDRVTEPSRLAAIFTGAWRLTDATALARIDRFVSAAEAAQQR